MKVLILPKRVFNSPLIEYANFADGSHINLIRLNKPYANGLSYAIDETTESNFCYNGMYKNLSQARLEFDKMVILAKNISNLTCRGTTNTFRHEK